jgi:hypothetical protein
MATILALNHHWKVTGDSTERVLDWKQELLGLAHQLHDLPPAARLAVLETVADFLREDVQALSG